jgi:hypothetical protein
MPADDPPANLGSVGFLLVEGDDGLVADAELVGDVVGRAEDDEFALAHDGDAFGEFLSFFQVVGGEDDAAGFAGDVLEDVPDGLAGVGVQS